MAEPKKTETEAIIKTEPVFKNRTKIDQVVYDKSNSAVTVRPGKTVIGECFRKYTGKRNSPLIQTEDPDIKEENILADQENVRTNKEGFPDEMDNQETKGKIAKNDKNKSGADSKGKK